MPRHLIRTSTRTAVVVGASAALAFSLPTRAQQSGGQDTGENGRATRGVVILKAEPKTEPAPPPPVVPKSCARPFAKTDIRTGRYGKDTARFDRDLARRLNGARQDVSVDVSEPWRVDSEPPMIVGRWLEEVKASGGKITVNEYCRKSRGFFSFFNRLFQRKPVDRLEAVKSYDAVLQIDGADQVITQVLFRRRIAG